MYFPGTSKCVSLTYQVTVFCLTSKYLLFQKNTCEYKLISLRLFSRQVDKKKRNFSFKYQVTFHQTIMRQTENITLGLPTSFKIYTNFLISTTITHLNKLRQLHQGQLVEALRYNSEGREFDSRWCHWNFSLT